MKNDKWLFIGSDQRFALCSTIMEGRGKNSRSVHADQSEELLRKELQQWQPNHIVLPLHQPAFPFPIENLQKQTNIYTGNVSEEYNKQLTDAGHHVESYVKEETFIWENARLTAEAFVHEYYRTMKKSIAGRHFYIAGFGRVGRMTAHVLSSLGASLTIIARAQDQIGEAEALGHKTEQLTDQFRFGAGELINTIPAKWLSMEKGDHYHVFDLASAPGCLKKNLSPEYYTVLLGLPGKHFPADASAVLADALERIQYK